MGRARRHTQGPRAGTPPPAPGDLHPPARRAPTKRCQRVATRAEANNVEITYTPINNSWLNRIEAQFTALRYFALNGTDHHSHKVQGSMIRCYITWRNKHAADNLLRAVVN